MKADTADLVDWEAEEKRLEREWFQQTYNPDLRTRIKYLVLMGIFIASNCALVNALFALCCFD